MTATTEEPAAGIRRRPPSRAAKAIEAVLRETKAFLGGRRAQGNLFAKLDESE